MSPVIKNQFDKFLKAALYITERGKRLERDQIMHIPRNANKFA